MGKPEGKRQLGRLRCGWQDNIKTDLKRNWGKTMCFIDLA
jgi:hypothetical protein